MWGIVTIATAAVKDVKGLLVARIFLAIFEATIGKILQLYYSFIESLLFQALR
jgi:hypothetical protein